MKNQFTIVPNLDPKSIRPNYRKLNTISDAKAKNYSTIDGLVSEYLLSRLNVVSILREANVWPAGRIRTMNLKTAKPTRGQPALAYEPAEARKAIDEALKKQM